MRDNIIRAIVLAVASMLALTLVSAWLRETEPVPALIGILAVGFIATSLLRSVRVPSWRLKRLRCSRRRQTRQPGWWPRGARQPDRIESGSAGFRRHSCWPAG